MCDQETAEQILKVVKRLPETDARKVLRFAETLTRPAPETMLLEDFIQTLPTVSAFQGDPARIQEALRCDWD